VGTAILAKSDQGETLFFYRQTKDGPWIEDSIPVGPKDSPNPSGLCRWDYVEKGDTLECSPSVRVSTTRPSKANPAVQETVELFHNDGQWSIKFKRDDGSGMIWPQLRAANGRSLD
jgi:hypothetical protein